MSKQENWNQEYGGESQSIEKELQNQRKKENDANQFCGVTKKQV